MKFLLKNIVADGPNLVGNNTNAFALYFYYNSILVEERTETLIYDLVDVFAAAGGYLGLCLGFSCLTLLVTLIEWMEARVRNWKMC